MSPTQPKKPTTLAYYPGKQEVAPQAECPECVEQEEEFEGRKFIGSGEDGNLYTEYNGHMWAEHREANCGDN